jgi:hypothetical protein
VSPDTLNDILGYVSTGAFALLGLVSLRHWYERRGRPTFWAALCFAALALVVLGGVVLPESPGNDLEAVLQRVAVIVLLVFPYCLFRFAAAFHRPSRFVEWLVGGVTVVLMVWTLALPDFPESGSPHSTFVDVYLIALSSSTGPSSRCSSRSRSGARAAACRALRVTACRC